MGTDVISGTANALVVGTGKQTEFGKVSERLKLRPEETEFERGIRRFGYFLMEVTLVLVVVIFAINVYLPRPVLESVLFSWRLPSGSRRNCCRRSSASTLPRAPSGWRRPE